MTEAPRRRLSRPILYATSAYPPRPGGSSILNRNLLRAFSPDSIVLATHKPPLNLPDVDFGGHRPIYVMNDFTVSTRLNFFIRRMQIPLTVRWLVRLARDYNCGAVVSSFPNIFLFDAAYRAAKAAGLPFIAYLHDTLAEALEHKFMGGFGQQVQARIFEHSDRILVMSQGMADLYRQKYNLDATPLVHSLPEPVPIDIQTDEPDKTAFWGGSVYDINDRSVVRIYDAITRMPGFKLYLACNDRREQMIAHGMREDGFILKYLPRREEYLQVLKRQAILILALNWPDETITHEDELATIFPTKTIEYLASGRPILVHCPENYFLARYFSERGCAEVVTERSEEALYEAAMRLINQRDHAQALARRALDAAQMFSLDRVAEQFQEIVEAVMGK
jgi:glycosyltransferase involved in cell wall biosynthesis